MWRRKPPDTLFPTRVDAPYAPIVTIFKRHESSLTRPYLSAIEFESWGICPKVRTDGPVRSVSGLPGQIYGSSFVCDCGMRKADRLGKTWRINEEVAHAFTARTIAGVVRP